MRVAVIQLAYTDSEPMAERIHRVASLVESQEGADLVVRLIDDGFQHRIALSQDHMCYDPHPRPLYWIPRDREEEIMTQIHPVHEWEIAGRPHTHLMTDFFPLLRERGVSDEQIVSIMTDNPRRFLLGA